MPTEPTPLPDIPTPPVRGDGPEVFRPAAEVWNNFQKEVLAPWYETNGEETYQNALDAAQAALDAEDAAGDALTQAERAEAAAENAADAVRAEVKDDADRAELAAASIATSFYEIGDMPQVHGFVVPQGFVAAGDAERALMVVPRLKTWNRFDKPWQIVPELVGGAGSLAMDGVGDPATNRADTWRLGTADVVLDYARERFWINGEIYYSLADAEADGAYDPAYDEWTLTTALPAGSGVGYSFAYEGVNPAQPANDTSTVILSIHDGAGSNTDKGVFVYRERPSGTHSLRMKVYANAGVLQTDLTLNGFFYTGGVYEGWLKNFSCSVALNDMAFSGNGSNVTSDSTATSPAGLVKIRFGTLPDGTLADGGAPRRFLLWATPASGDERRTRSQMVEPPRYLFSANHPGMQGEAVISRNGFTYFTWLTALGEQGVARIDEETGLVDKSVFLSTRFRVNNPNINASYPTFESADNHNWPGLAFDGDGQLIVTYAHHNNATWPYIYYRISPTGRLEDFGPEHRFQNTAQEPTTYCFLYRHPATGDVWSFNRYTIYKWGIAKLASGGSTFGAVQEIMTHSDQLYVQGGGWLDEDKMLIFASNNPAAGVNDAVMLEIDFDTGDVRILGDGVVGNILTGDNLPLEKDDVSTFVDGGGGTWSIGGITFGMTVDEIVYTRSNVPQSQWTYNYGIYGGSGDRLDPANWTFEEICSAGDFPHHAQPGHRIGRRKLLEPLNGIPRAICGRVYHGGEYGPDGISTMEEWRRDPVAGWYKYRTLASAPKTDHGNEGRRAIFRPIEVVRDKPSEAPLAIEVLWQDYVYYNDQWWSQATIEWERP